MSTRPKRGRAPSAPAKDNARKRRVTNDPDAVEEQITAIMRIRGRPTLTREARLDVLRVYFGICRAWHEKKQKTGRVEKLDAINKTAALLGRSSRMVSSIVKSWTDALEAAGGSADALDAGDVAEPGTDRGNFKAKPARVKHSREVYHLVRDFVREKRKNRERVTAAQVLDFLVKEQQLEDPPKTINGEIPNKVYKAALQAVRRFLKRRGFVRGKKHDTVMVKAEHIAWRNQYLAALKANRALPPKERLREVYLDESYIHKNYHRFEYSLHDPNDPFDEVYKTPNKGQQYCFLAAIQGHSFRTTELPGLVPGSVWIFCPQHKKGKSNPHTGDVHKVFNGENFMTWWKEQLLPNLHEPSLIIMDNAAYHKTKPPGTPKPGKMLKAELLDALVDLGIPHVATITAVEAKLKLSSFINDNVPAEAVQLAEAAGHKVLFTPPHYSDLQPIELVWARIKDNVGRAHSANRGMKDVKAHLDAEFAALDTEEGKLAIRDIIKSVDKKINEFWEEIEAFERQADVQDQESDSECSSVDEEGGESNDIDESQAL